MKTLNNSIKTLFLIVVIILLCFGCRFNLFPESSPILLETIDLDEAKNIKIYKSFSNATTEESIQIRTSLDSLNAKVVYERYDLLVENYIRDQELILVLRDTSAYKSITDTFRLKIVDLFSE